MRRVVFSLVAGLVMALSPMASSAFDLSKARPHVTFNLGSYHHNASRNFEETNPGIGFGLSWDTGWQNTEAAIEAGFYRNSLGGQSQYVTASLDAPVADITPRTELRLGVFAGTAHYPGHQSEFKSAGVPSMGDWILVGGGQATVRFDDRTDLRVRVMPAGRVADSLVTLQMAVRF